MTFHSNHNIPALYAIAPYDSQRAKHPLKLHQTSIYKADPTPCAPHFPALQPTNQWRSVDRVHGGGNPLNIFGNFSPNSFRYQLHVYFHRVPVEPFSYILGSVIACVVFFFWCPWENVWLLAWAELGWWWVKMFLFWLLVI